MAASRRYTLHPQLDIQQILLEAQNRWLRPSEVCEILRNYQKFCLTPDPPFKPPGGSLFLFDRKALRYFRKDGHRWRKKKDGKTVREAHEKLKSGSVDVLHCYYAHGEDNENFQRRSYWLLDGQLEHIVLVHYREVKEGNKSGIPHMLNTDPGSQNHTGSAQTSPTPFSSHGSPAVAAQVSNASSGSTADWNGHSPSSEFEDADSVEDFGASSFVEPISGPRFQIDSIHGSEIMDKNTFVYSGTISHSYPRGSRDATETNDGSCNPFNVNQVIPQNLISSLGHQSAYGSSEEAGLFGRSSFNHDASPATWSEILSSNRNIASMYEQKIFSNCGNDTELKAKKVAGDTLDAPNIVKNELDAGSNVSPNAQLQKFLWSSVQEHLKMENVEHAGCFPGDKHTVNDVGHLYPEAHEQTFHSMAQFKTNRGLCTDVATVDQSLGFETEDCQTLKDALESSLYNDEQRGLKKLDSFGRWMNKEIGKDCDDSLMASDSSNFWSALDTQDNEKEVSSLSRHMQLDVDSLGPSLSQDQLFSIVDFSPDWGYSGVETKVLIVGTFLGGIKHPSSNKWCCMFGEVEVSAENLTNNALRCQVPAHSPGRVPFYITRNNRLACSEVREFEYREKTLEFPLCVTVKRELGDERQLQIRLAKMLFQGVDKKWLDCSDENCDKCSRKNSILSMRSDENEWDMIEKASKALEGNQEKCSEVLIQKLLKDRLYEWLVCKLHDEGRGPNVLDDGGQGVIHLAAALGYEWAMSPIVAAGVSPSFRDARGRTGLHWAAYYGREETVVELVRLGAAPGALEDPTSQFPEGRTAADLASIIGHKGIAGYLAEADLTSHLSSLAIKESVTGSVSVEKSIIESEEDQNIVPLAGGREELVSLKGSLAAVRNSAQAAARIQAAFRLNSFRQRQLTKNSDEESEIPSELIVLASRNNLNQKIGHFSDSLHSAAVRIQQKYRGWKGRKEFLKIRNRIVKIQAHVRGHQVRKQYKKVIWSVSIVEKLILRWRRKKTGLRGFRADKAIGSVEPEIETTDEYDFLSLGRKQKGAGVEKALARVQSMARYPEARDQYMRMVTNSQKSKMGDERSTPSQVQSTKEGKADEEDPLASMTD